MSAILKMEGISVRYGKVKALDNFYMMVFEHEILGLIGYNGSGKTTVLKVISGIVKPNNGKIFVKDNIIDTRDKRYKILIGYSPQDNIFFNKLNVRENLKYFAYLYNIKNVNIVVEGAAKYFKLWNKMDTLAENLSGGMKRRLNIACAMLHNPKILLLDEPSLGLDPARRKELWELIKTIRNRGIAVIISTNIMEEAEYLCDRLIVLYNGKSLYDGPVENAERYMLYGDNL